MIGTYSVLFTVSPFSIILSSVWPCENSLALLLVIEILPCVHAPIVPSEYSVAMHFVVVPLAVELSAIRPSVNTLTLYVIV
jgi:hypothetical protein